MSESVLKANDPHRFWGMGEVLRLSIPTSLGMITNVLMQFVDGLMVSRIQPNGPEALSAQTTASLLSFTSTAFLIGVLAVVNTFVSQNLGAERYRRCAQYAWQGIYISLIFSALLMPLALLARPIVGVFHHAEPVQTMEVTYFQYLMAATVLFLIPNVLQQFFYGIQRPGLVYVSSIVANAVNLVAAYMLIFGKWGAPNLGVMGAAVGAIIGTTAAGLVLGWAFFVGKSARKFQIRRFTQWRLPLAGDLLRVGWPAGFQMFADVLGWSVILAVLVGGIQTIYGHWDADASTVHLAASVVAMRYMPLSFMPAVGIGVAATALVGQYIGERRIDLARRRAYACLLLALLYMGMCGLTFALFRYPLVRFFINISSASDPVTQMHLQEVIRIGAAIMVCAAVFQLFDAVGIVFISALRGAGDTLWPAVVQALLNLVIMVGGGYTMVRMAPQLESIGVWMAGSAYVIAFGFAVFWRFYRGKWQQIDLLEHPGAAKGFPDAAAVAERGERAQ